MPSRASLAGLVLLTTASLLAVVSPTAAVSSPASPAVALVEPQYEASEQGVDTPAPQGAPTAEFMRRQDAAGRMLSALERESVAGFLSLSLDESGKVVVRGAPALDRKRVLAVAEEHGVSDPTFEVVPRSRRALEARVDEVEAAAAASGFQYEGIDSRTGRLRVFGEGQVEPQTPLGQLVRREPDLVAAQENVIKRTVPRACQAPFCDPPLRGGVRIISNAACSAGFNVISNTDNKPYLLTAGHCLQGLGPPGALWYTRNSLAAGQYIGAAWRYVYDSRGDYGIIKFDPSTYYPGQAYAGVVQWGTGGSSAYNRPVTNISGSSPGFFICHSGAFSATGTGSVCDGVNEIGVKATYDDGTVVQNLGRWGYRGPGGASACPRTAASDSGGPFWDTSGNGYGLISAEQYTVDSRTGAYLECSVLYQSLALATQNLNVRLRTTTGF